MSLTETHRYDDIIDLPHHQSQTHAHMSMHNRTAQYINPPSTPPTVL